MAGIGGKKPEERLCYSCNIVDNEVDFFFQYKKKKKKKKKKMTF